MLGWLWYAFLQVVCQGVFPAGFLLRMFGREHLPAEGGVLLLSNHQSFLDPILVALALPRHVRYLARESLFRTPGFRWLIKSLGAVPIRRGGMGAGGIRQSLAVLRAGEVLLVFPEGTRTRDGRIGAMRAGLGLLAKRAVVPVVPVAIHGAFEAWPRSAKVFRFSPVRVGLAKPVAPGELAGLETREVAEAVRERVVACHEAIQAPARR